METPRSQGRPAILPRFGPPSFSFDSTIAASEVVPDESDCLSIESRTPRAYRSDQARKQRARAERYAPVAYRGDDASRAQGESTGGTQGQIRAAQSIPPTDPQLAQIGRLPDLSGAAVRYRPRSGAAAPQAHATGCALHPSGYPRLEPLSTAADGSVPFPVPGPRLERDEHGRQANAWAFGRASRSPARADRRAR